MTDESVELLEPPHFRIYGEYVGNGPAFYPPEEFAWVQTLQQNWTVIRDEFEDYVYRKGKRLTPNFAPDPVELTGWLGVDFFTYLRRYRGNCRHFPKTVSVLESIPNLASAFISLLEPHSSLPAHHGETNTLYRVHMGLIVPGDVNQCGIQVGGERSGWKEGEVLLFNDARQHFVWNHTDLPRVVLICDVMKPQYGGASPRTCGKVYGSLAITFLQTRLPMLRRLPRPVLAILHAGASFPFQVLLTLFGARLAGRSSAEICHSM